MALDHLPEEPSRWVTKYESVSNTRGWREAVLPAIVAADPVYRGDRQAFCAAYGANGYAPDLP
jgi:hypothetical protein